MPRARKTREARFSLLGMGAMNSPRYRPAGLLLEFVGNRIMLDGGPGAEPHGTLDAWLVTDSRGELIREIRSLARKRGLEACVGSHSSVDFTLKPLSVVHTSHPSYGYLFQAHGRKVVWAPEFFRFPTWARDADLMFAEAASWNRRILFVNRAGGHSSVVDVAKDAGRCGVKRLVYAHIGRSTIRAMDAGHRPPWGEFGIEGHTYRLRILPPQSI